MAMLSQLVERRSFSVGAGDLILIVRRDVALEQVLSCERFPANPADEGTLFGVASNMADKMIRATILGLANATLVQSCGSFSRRGHC